MSDVRNPSTGENPIVVGLEATSPAGDEAQDVFVFPASFSQRRLWFLDALEPGSPAYNIHAAIRLTGPLDVHALDASFQAVVARHESLRTAFVLSEGKPFQVISERLCFEIAVEDLRALGEVSREEEIRRLATEEARAPFDLSVCPLARARLLLLDDEEHVLLLTVHHIVADGWSMGIIYRDLTICYASELKGETPELPELAIQYVDYATWQEEFVESADVKTQLSFWLESFGDELPVLDLPTRLARPELRSSVGRTEWLELDPSLVEASVAFCRAGQITRFMLHLAALNVMFHKYSGQDEVIVGSPAANRDRPEVEACVGFFANTVAFRTDLSGGPTFRELLRQVHEFSLRVYANQDVPFETVVEALNPARDLSHTPLFQVMFAMQPTPDELFELPGIDVGFMQFDNGTSKFDLHIEFQETSTGLRGAFEYSTEIFDTSTIRGMIDDYQDLLRQLIEDPDRSIDELRLLSLADQGDRTRLPGSALEVDDGALSESGRDELLVEWNLTEREFPPHVSVHELFEKQVQRTPEAVAVRFDTAQLTYRELDARVNQLAHHLRKRGVGPEVLVGLYMERSLEMVIGLMGVLKAGGAYVPLDPEYPPERVAFMLTDSEVPVLLTLERLTGSLPAFDRNVVRLDADGETISREPREAPEDLTGTDDLAYVIYTSGSTGRPKGAMITHRAICNRLLWMQSEYRLSTDDTVLQKTPFSFDVSVWEFFWPLMTGARMVLAKPGGHMDAAYLTRLIAAEGVTVMHFVPSMLRVFLEGKHLETLDSLRHVFCSGEALSYALQQRFFARLDADLHNLYGPTEAAVDVTYHQCERDGDREMVPIGRPVANTRIHLLDEELRPVPIGRPGELHIGGVQLARGYYKRDELTAEKFIRDPFTDDGRLYKTGDLARFLPDGNIEYLGRIDHQVKIRGFRIELGEIEAAIGALGAVSEAIVIAREDSPDDKRLVAYLVPAAGSEAPTTSELRSHLKSKLPPYMVPSEFVFMDALPLTPSGKVDRRALPAPEESREGRAGEYVAPRTELEERLAGIWARALKLDRVGVTDNFFDLGGHSLLAVGMMTEIEKAFGIDVPLATLFRAPSIEKLAALLDTGSQPGSVTGKERSLANERRHVCLVPMQPEGAKAPIYLVHGVGGNVLYFSDLVRRLGEDQPCYGLQAKGVDGKTTPHSSVREMAAFYIEEVRDVQPDGPYLLCGFSAGGLIAFEMAKQLHAVGERVALLALLDTPHPDSHGPRRRRDVKHGQKSVAASLKARARRIRNRLKERIKNARIRWCKRRRKPLPASLRPQHLAVHFFEALKSHDIGDYPGDVVIFKTEAELATPGADMGWGPHVSEVAEVVEFDGGHGAFLREPRVEEFSKILRRVVEARTRTITR